MGGSVSFKEHYYLFKFMLEMGLIGIKIKLMIKLITQELSVVFRNKKEEHEILIVLVGEIIRVD